MYLADIVAAVIVLVFVLIGVHNGLVKSVLGLSSIVISLILALVLYPVVSDFLSKSVIGTYVTENVQNVIGGEVTEPDTAEKKDQNLNLPDSIMQTVNDSVSQVTNSVTNAISGSVASLAINLISILAVFLIVRLLVWLLACCAGCSGTEASGYPYVQQAAWRRTWRGERHHCGIPASGSVDFFNCAKCGESTCRPGSGFCRRFLQMYSNNFLLHFLDK